MLFIIHSSSPQNLQNNGQIPYILSNVLLTSSESSEIILPSIIWSFRTTYQSPWFPNSYQSVHTFLHRLLLLPKISLSVMSPWKMHLPDSSLVSTLQLTSYSLPDPPAHQLVTYSCIICPDKTSRRITQSAESQKIIVTLCL